MPPEARSSTAAPCASRLQLTLAGVPVGLGWNDEALAAPLRRVAAYFGTAALATDAPACTLAFARGPARHALPAEAHPLSTSPQGLGFFRHDTSIYLRYEDALVQVEPTEGWARAHLGPGFDAMSPAVQDALLFAACYYSVVLLLYARGARTAHTACLVHGGAGWLFAGPSDSGKSTLTLRLVEQGWHYLTDDAVLLRRIGERVRAFPLRRDFCIDPEAAALFPQVVPHWEPHMGDVRKRRLRITELYPAQEASACLPRVLVFPRIVQAATSTLVPLDRRTALVALMQHSGALNLLDARTAARHLDDLRTLVEQVTPYTLRAGRDLRDDPYAAALLLASVAPEPLPEAAPDAAPDAAPRRAVFPSQLSSSL